MKQYIVAGLAGMVTAAGLITAGPPASAGCIDPDWPGHPLAQMCDDPVTEDGMWQRCVTYYPNGVRNLGETDCYLMSAGVPPSDDPVLSTPPTHIDP
jgi:hypothetical protein